MTRHFPTSEYTHSCTQNAARRNRVHLGFGVGIFPAIPIGKWTQCPKAAVCLVSDTHLNIYISPIARHLAHLLQAGHADSGGLSHFTPRLPRDFISKTPETAKRRRQTRAKSAISASKSQSISAPIHLPSRNSKERSEVNILSTPPRICISRLKDLNCISRGHVIQTSKKELTACYGEGDKTVSKVYLT